MRRIYGIASATCAVVLALGVATAGPAGAAGDPCTATVNGKVTLTTSGLVKAPSVSVTCPGQSWTAVESLQYVEVGTFSAYRKWSYGGDKTVTGTGNATLAGFKRDYSEGCTSWRLHVVLNGAAFNGPSSEFCS